MRLSSGCLRRVRFVSSLVLAAAVSAALFAQRKDSDGQPRNTIGDEVRHELVMLPFYTVFDNLNYAVKGDEVTLSGQVVNATVKESAAKAVEHIEGVTKVINDIQVLPVSPMDDELRRAEFRAIYGDPALQRYASGTLRAIHIIVNAGHVTLEGVVGNAGDKDIVTVRAKSVPNVFSVTNNLRVETSGRTEK
jgi:hyperosmotically inducible protein